MIHFVYALVDPRIVRNFSVDPRYLPPLGVLYVGMTSDPNGRYHAHLQNTGRSNVPKIEQFEAFRTAKVIPQMILLETVYSGKIQAEYLESEWISYFLAQGAPLLNANKIRDRDTNSVIFSRLDSPFYLPASLRDTFRSAQTLEVSLRDTDYTDRWVDTYLPSWIEKNELVYWITGHMIDTELDLAQTSASLCMLPLEEHDIESLLTGKREVSDIPASAIPLYEPEGAYACYIASVLCKEGQELELSRLFQQSLLYLSHRNIHINRVYVRTASAEKTSGPNIVLKAFVQRHAFDPIPSTDPYAWGFRPAKWAFSESVATYQQRIRHFMIEKLRGQYNRLPPGKESRRAWEREVEGIMLQKFGLKRSGLDWLTMTDAEYLSLPHPPIPE